MYIRKINYQNVGPLENIDIDLPFNNGLPMPLIIVGGNGAGKSLLLSNIVDAMYEIGGKIYENVAISDSSVSHYFYKLSQAMEVQIGKQYSTAYIKFANEESSIEYITKNGSKNFEEWKKETGIFDSKIKWKSDNDNDNDKYLTDDQKTLSLLFDKNICCYFSPNRYTKPFWLSDHYFNDKQSYESTGFKVIHKFSRKLYNSITVENSINDNISWLLDVLLDARMDVEENSFFNVETKQIEKSYSIANHVNQNDFSLLNIAKKNMEIILSDILGQEVFFRAKYRNTGAERICVVDKQGNIILKSLEALSTGQMALFNIFSNIVRYADSHDLNKSIKLGEIQGIVVVDEIDLHLHGDLQYTTLPKLLKKFPRIQFVITSHSPLFVLGMEKVFGERNFQIRELPENQIILPEEFSQFYNAFNMLKESKKYRAEINAVKSSHSTAPLIVTEGTSDWIHIKNALTKLKSQQDLPIDVKEKLDGIKIEFLEYYPKGSKNGYLELEMGDSAMIQLCEQFSRIQQPRKYIFIADRDKSETIKKLSVVDKRFKAWGNNVYSFCIPYPKGRAHDNNLCIEHYYTEKELKLNVKCDDGIKRRLFLGTEFDTTGVLLEDNRKCENIGLCGVKQTIIDGSEKRRVFVNDISKITEEEARLGITAETNFGLSKIKFAEAVSNHQDFQKINLTKFISIFDIISEIVSLR